MGPLQFLFLLLFLEPFLVFVFACIGCSKTCSRATGSTHRTWVQQWGSACSLAHPSSQCVGSLHLLRLPGPARRPVQGLVPIPKRPTVCCCTPGCRVGDDRRWMDGRTDGAVVFGGLVWQCRLNKSSGHENANWQLAPQNSTEIDCIECCPAVWLFPTEHTEWKDSFVSLPFFLSFHLPTDPPLSKTSACQETTRPKRQLCHYQTNIKRFLAGEEVQNIFSMQETKKLY